MDTTTNPEYTFSGALASGRDEERMSEEVEEDKEDQPNKNERRTFSDLAQNNLLEHKAQTQSCAPAQWTCNSEGENQDWHSIKWSYCIPSAHKWSPHLESTVSSL